MGDLREHGVMLRLSRPETPEYNHAVEGNID